MDYSAMMRDYVDKSDALVEARLGAKLDRLPTAESLRNNVWGAALTVLGILLAIAAFAGDRFEAGMSISPAIEASRGRQQQVDEQQNEKFRAIDQKRDILISRKPKDSVR